MIKRGIEILAQGNWHSPFGHTLFGRLLRGLVIIEGSCARCRFLFIVEYLLYIWRPLGKGNGCAPVRGFLFLIKADLKGPDRCGVCWRRVQRERKKPQSQCAQTPRACRQRQGLTQRHSVAGKRYLRVETSRQIPGGLKP